MQALHAMATTAEEEKQNRNRIDKKDIKRKEKWWWQGELGRERSKPSVLP